jgi:hypothetical protein
VPNENAKDTDNSYESLTHIGPIRMLSHSPRVRAVRASTAVRTLALSADDSHGIAYVLPFPGDIFAGRGGGGLLVSSSMNEQ